MTQGMAHDHGHRHDHTGQGRHAHGPHGQYHGPGHGHAPARFGTAFAVGIALNTGFVLVEAAFGLLSDSVALLADAGHNLSDVLGLVVAWAAATLGRRAPSARFTYGLRSSSILAALFNAVFLLVATGGIAWEAIGRLQAPPPVAGGTVIVVALIGIAINGITAWLFASGRESDLNIRGAYLHMLADAAVSAGVVLAGIAILATGWTWIDPLVSLVIVAVIVAGTWGLLRDSVILSLAAVPPGIDPAAVRRCLAERPGVAEVHDLHVWAMSTTETALTAHLVMPAGHPGNHFLGECARVLRERFGIAHVTLQVELAGGPACALAPESVV
ncbi:cation diffusion facilitator family transporter [Methylobacterium isbiliense]|jgi:cobalt-zinc-cadmium efflux system protein|uniref:Cadmium, cobalt and zinc/H(+)-K(+) antiporter n=2 Tax=Methylobacterium isbiliense TaxID=315478 RepID=A0ABQ4SQZ4_9HYPH|nr:cation diffusion facilitator family transporter [Methylobacterium isbiliense]MDN3627594.1 cation diffusion facilitator family transporter [Methylobacterium isbiliense]GJE04233.1 Cadmium, cobalt and zinc/H(+)-K(+) antiporter [Methylobacterium isbiliense]